MREHVEGHERACEGSREKVLQSRKASTAQNMKFLGEKILAIKSDNISPYFKANSCLYQTLPLRQSDRMVCIVVFRNFSKTKDETEEKDNI